ncbi:MAG: hypothetical protein AAGA17_02715 [Actinomycetota bacterium]
MSPDAKRRSQLALLAAPIVWIGLIGTIALLASPDPQELSEEVAALVGRDIVVVGDSLVVDAEPQFRTVLAGTELRIEAAPGRPLSRGLEIDGTLVLDELDDEPPEIVVIALARNDIGDDDHAVQVASAMDSFPESCVIWVNGAPAANDAMRAVNDVIDDAAAQRSNVHVADWATALDPRTDTWLSERSGALTDDGRWGFARTVADAISTECL